MLKAAPPREKPGSISPAVRFRHAKRGVTQRRGNRRTQTKTKKGGGDVRTQWAAMGVTITGLPVSKGFHVQPAPNMRGGLDPAPQDVRKVHDPSSPSQAGQDSVRPDHTEGRNPGIIAGTSDDVSAAPDVSAEFRSEMAALRAFYAARIGAARRGAERRSLSASEVAAIVRALVNEQTIAMRALAERWSAATQKQRQEKPQRPIGKEQRKDEDRKPS